MQKLHHRRPEQVFALEIEMVTGGRTSQRQAVVVMAASEPGSALGALGHGLDEADGEALLRCRLIDSVTALVGIDGATLTVVTDSAAAAREYAALLPAGIDVTAATTPASDVAAVMWATAALLERAFERVVVLMAGSVPVAPRVLATALSVAGTADVVVGPTPAGGLYLVGVHGPPGLAVIEAAGLGGVAAVRAAAAEAGSIVRNAEQRLVFGDLPDVAALRRLIAADPTTAPAIGRWLDRLPAS